MYKYFTKNDKSLNWINWQFQFKTIKRGFMWLHSFFSTTCGLKSSVRHFDRFHWAIFFYYYSHSPFCVHKYKRMVLVYLVLASPFATFSKTNSWFYIFKNVNKHHPYQHLCILFWWQLIEASCILACSNMSNHVQICPDFSWFVQNSRLTSSHSFDGNRGFMHFGFGFDSYLPFFD